MEDCVRKPTLALYCADPDGRCTGRLAVPAAEAAPGWPLLAGTRNATAPSHVFSRGDVELLTFEPRQDYAKLWSTSEPLPYGWIMPLTLPHDCVAVKDGKIISGGHFNSDWKRNKP